MQSQIRPIPLSPAIVTLTGADERTDLDRLIKMVATNPRLEVGLLYTTSPEGRNRYPSYEWLRMAASLLSGRCAIHICGKGARDQLLVGALAQITVHAARVQVNGVVQARELADMAVMASVLITQHTPANDQLKDLRINNHQLLVDGSGGRGRSPEQWVRPGTHKLVGFAGGLGPDNLEGELQKLMLLADGPWWIDAESKLRTDDWFDLDTCQCMLDIVKNHRHGRGA